MIPTGCRLLPKSYHCGRGQTPIDCPGCGLTSYCSPFDRDQDRDVHKTVCDQVVGAQNCCEIEQYRLANLKSKLDTSLPLVEQLAWQEWHLPEGEGVEWYKTHSELVDLILSNFGKPNSFIYPIQVCLDIMTEITRYGNTWALADLKDKILPVYIRLGRDSEAYNMIHWLAAYRNEQEDWWDKDPPFATMKDAEILGTLDPLLNGKLNLSNLAALTLIKIRALHDLHSLSGNPDYPPDLLAGSIVVNRENLRRGDDAEYTAWIVELARQVRELHNYIDKRYPKFWNLFLNNPSQVENDSSPDLWKDEESKQTNLAILDNYAAWEETPGAASEILNVRLHMEFNPE